MMPSRKVVLGSVQPSLVRETNGSPVKLGPTWLVPKLWPPSVDSCTTARPELEKRWAKFVYSRKRLPLGSTSRYTKVLKPPRLLTTRGWEKVLPPSVERAT